jgi:hypothetical protein
MYVADTKYQQQVLKRLSVHLKPELLQRFTPGLPASVRVDLAGWLMAQINHTASEDEYELAPPRVLRSQQSDLLVYFLKVVQTVPLWTRPWFRLHGWRGAQLEGGPHTDTKTANQPTKRHRAKTKTKAKTKIPLIVGIRPRKLRLTTRRAMFQRLSADAQLANWLIALVRATEQGVHQQSCSFWCKSHIQRVVRGELSKLYPGIPLHSVIHQLITSGDWLTAEWTGQLIYTLEFPSRTGPLVEVAFTPHPDGKTLTAAGSLLTTETSRPSKPSTEQWVQFRSTVTDEQCVRSYLSVTPTVMTWTRGFVQASPTLSLTQQQALQAIQNQQLTIIVGEAGTGKSYLLSQLAQLGPYNICFTTPYKRTVSHLTTGLRQQLTMQGFGSTSLLERSSPCHLCTLAPSTPKSPSSPVIGGLGLTAGVDTSTGSNTGLTPASVPGHAIATNQPSFGDRPDQDQQLAGSPNGPRCSWVAAHDSQEVIQVMTTCSWSTHYHHCRQDHCHQCHMRVLVIDEVGLASTQTVANAIRWVQQSSERRLVLAGDPSQMPTISGGSVLAAMIALRPDWVVRLQGDQRTTRSQADNCNILNMAHAILKQDPAIPHGHGVHHMEYDSLAQTLPSIQTDPSLDSIVVTGWNSRVHHLNRYLSNQHRRQLDAKFKPVSEPVEDSDIPGFKWIPPFRGAIVRFTVGPFKDQRGVVVRCYRVGQRWCSDVELDPSQPANHRQSSWQLYHDVKTKRKRPPSVPLISSTTVVNVPNTYLRFAYAMTVNSAQGSEFAHVYLLLDNWSKLNARFLYTAVTRAKHRFTLVTRRHDPVYQTLIRRGFPCLVRTTLIAADVTVVPNTLNWTPPVLIADHLPPVVHVNTGIDEADTPAHGTVFKQLVQQSPIMGPMPS